MMQLLYHATTEDNLETILKDGFLTANSDNNRNKFTNDTNFATCFTRNIRYAIHAKDDQGKRTTGIEHTSVILIFNRDKMATNYKINLVSHTTATINAIDFLRKNQDKLNQEMLFKKDEAELRAALDMVAEDFLNILNRAQKPFAIKIKELAKKHSFEVIEENLFSPQLTFINIAQQLSPENFSLFLQDVRKVACQPKHRQSLESEEIIKTKIGIVNLEKLGFVGWTYPKEKWTQKHPNENFEDWLKTLPQYMQNTYINSPTTLDNTLSNIEKMRAKTIPSTLKRTTPP